MRFKRLRTKLEKYFERVEDFVFGKSMWVVAPQGIIEVERCPAGIETSKLSPQIAQAFDRFVHVEGAKFTVTVTGLLSWFIVGWDKFYGEVLEDKDGTIFVYGQFLPSPLARACMRTFVVFFLVFLAAYVLIAIRLVATGQAPVENAAIVGGLSLLLFMMLPVFVRALRWLMEIFKIPRRNRLLNKLKRVVTSP